MDQSIETFIVGQLGQINSSLFRIAELMDQQWAVKSEPSRLEIAAMIMQGLLSNVGTIAHFEQASKEEGIKTNDAIAGTAIRLADALIGLASQEKV